MHVEHVLGHVSVDERCHCKADKAAGRRKSWFKR
jgi:hypothetical protein